MEMREKCIAHLDHCCLSFCLCYCGCAGEMHVEISCGNNYWSSRTVTPEEGRCRWYQEIKDSKGTHSTTNTLYHQHSLPHRHIMRFSMLVLMSCSWLHCVSVVFFFALLCFTVLYCSGEHPTFTYPTDLEQVPNVYLYLCDKKRRIAWLSFPFKVPATHRERERD